jgi:hypothetical protein
MSVKLERFHDAFPYDLAEIPFRHRRGINVRGAASSVRLNILANGLYAFTCASTISARSRTVQEVFVTPAMEAGIEKSAWTVSDLVNAA